MTSKLPEPRSLFSINFQTAMKIGARLASSKPKSAARIAHIIKRLETGDSIRKKLEKTGLIVPPLAIISITRQCNLNCAGCYSNAVHEGNEVSMTPEKLRKLIGEAETLGISAIFLAGGEPLMRQDLLDVAAGFPDTLFIVFTNGTLLDNRTASFFRTNAHIIPVISLEGDEDITDARRGAGTFSFIESAMTILKESQVLFGASITVTSDNIGMVASDAFVASLVKKGVDIVFHVEFVPQRQEEEVLALDPVQKSFLSERAEALQKRHHALVVAFPGDETEYGGCLAAGRGFLHVSPDGSLTPCPFSSATDANVLTDGLEYALRSPLLKMVREHHHELLETKGGCALARNRKLIDTWMLDDSRTSIDGLLKFM
jgi:MoaA/NifB/PqqE/SkfB family radical SAM enzyme